MLQTAKNIDRNKRGRRKPLSRNDRDKLAAIKALGDLSDASMWQLGSLYDALKAVADAWLSAQNQPRTGFEGDSERGLEICEAEAARAFWMRREVARLVSVLPPHQVDREEDRARVLADWKYITGGDDDWTTGKDAESRKRAREAKS